MSKSRRNGRKQSQEGITISKKWLIAVGVIISLLVIGGLVAIFSRPTFEPEVTGAPAIEVEQSFFDLGDMAFNEVAQVTYRIKNIGDQPLQVTEIPNVQVLEGC